MSIEQWGVGDPAKARVFDKAQYMDDGSPFEVLYGEHPHSRNDNKLYARFPDGRIEDFDGHRIRTRIDLRTFNYLKCSGLSGNEVRKGGQFRIYLNDRLVWAKFIREADAGLLAAHHTLGELMGCPLRHWDDGFPDIGRRIFYREVPAVVTAFYCDENEGSGNRLVIESADGSPFPPPVWLDEDDHHEPSNRIVTNTLDQNIWWFRDAAPEPQGGK